MKIVNSLCYTLGGTILRDQGVTHLCDALKDENCKLTKLYLGGNDIRDQGVTHLCDALKDENCKLTTLYLERNNINRPRCYSPA